MQSSSKPQMFICCAMLVFTVFSIECLERRRATIRCDLASLLVAACPMLSSKAGSRFGVESPFDLLQLSRAICAAFTGNWLWLVCRLRSLDLNWPEREEESSYKAVEKRRGTGAGVYTSVDRSGIRIR